jgi:excisionase family DNA binding protein
MEDNVMDKLLLTPTEAATALGIGRSKVYELMRAGTLRSIRIDSCRRVPAEDLTALVERLRSAGEDNGHTGSGAHRT